VGVHVLNREARADVTYSAHIWVREGWDIDPLLGATVEFNFAEDNGNWVPAQEDGNGWYSVNRANYTQSSWKIRVTNPPNGFGVDPEQFPLGDPATHITVNEWVVGFIENE